MAEKIKLSKERYLALLQAQRALHDILPEFEKAEDCDIDCQELRAVHADASNQIQKIIDNYGPASK